MTRATTSLIRLPSDFATDLGQRFLRILLVKAGLGFDRIKTAQALARGAFGILQVVERKQARAEVTRKKALDELESGLKFQATLDIEQVIRQDLEIKAYDTLRCRCNELADSLGAIVSSGRECPSDLIEAVCTIIWAAGQAEVPPELMVAKAQLSKKYGKSLVVKAEKNEGGCVDKCVATRLSFQADPSPLLVKEYIETMTAEVEKRQKASSSPPSPYSFFSRIKMKPRAPSSTACEKENATAGHRGAPRKKSYWRTPAQLRTHPMDENSGNTL